MGRNNFNTFREAYQNSLDYIIVIFVIIVSYIIKQTDPAQIRPQ